MQEQLWEHRKHLIIASQKAQEDFDKTVISLSGGSLGVSFVFLKDIIKTNPILVREYLLFAWIAWASSATAILASFYFSNQALDKALEQVDKIIEKNEKPDGITPGGSFTYLTSILNAIGGILFLLGVISMGIFVYNNVR